MGSEKNTPYSNFSESFPPVITEGSWEAGRTLPTLIFQRISPYSDFSVSFPPVITKGLWEAGRTLPSLIFQGVSFRALEINDLKLLVFPYIRMTR